jgi:hypothetical protein
MNVEYVPLLHVARDLHAIPLAIPRLPQYLRTIGGQVTVRLGLPPLVAMIPMGREHVGELLDQLLATDADGISDRAVAEAIRHLADDPGEFKAALVIADDLRGG